MIFGLNIIKINKFGIAIKPLAVSDKDQTVPVFKTEPSITEPACKNTNHFHDAFPKRNCAHLAP